LSHFVHIVGDLSILHDKVVAGQTLQDIGEYCSNEIRCKIQRHGFLIAEHRAVNPSNDVNNQIDRASSGEADAQDCEATLHQFFLGHHHLLAERSP